MGNFRRNNSSREKGRSRARSSRGHSRDEVRQRDRSPSRSSRDFGAKRTDRQEATKVICASCNKECEVPFKPRSNKPVYCNECFGKDSFKKKGSSNSDVEKELALLHKKLDKIMQELDIEMD